MLSLIPLLILSMKAILPVYKNKVIVHTLWSVHSKPLAFRTSYICLSSSHCSSISLFFASPPIFRSRLHTANWMTCARHGICIISDFQSISCFRFKANVWLLLALSVVSAKIRSSIPCHFSTHFSMFTRYLPVWEPDKDSNPSNTSLYFQLASMKYLITAIKASLLGLVQASKASEI